MASFLHEIFLRRVPAHWGNGTDSVKEDIIIFSEEDDRLSIALEGPASPQMEEPLEVQPPVEETVVLPLREVLLFEESPWELLSAPNADCEFALLPSTFLGGVGLPLLEEEVELIENILSNSLWGDCCKTNSRLNKAFASD